jgi:hypothetical protein
MASAREREPLKWEMGSAISPPMEQFPVGRPVHDTLRTIEEILARGSGGVTADLVMEIYDSLCAMIELDLEGSEVAEFVDVILSDDLASSVVNCRFVDRRIVREFFCTMAKIVDRLMVWKIDFPGKRVVKTLWRVFLKCKDFLALEMEEAEEAREWYVNAMQLFARLAMLAMTALVPSFLC